MEKLGKSVSNRDRFEKLKESRQKYKDEAAEAKKRCALLEEQIEKLQLQQQEKKGSDGGPSAGSTSATSNEERELRLQLKIAQEIARRLEQQVVALKAALSKCEASLAEAQEEAKAMRQRAEEAEAKSSSSSSSGPSAGAGAGAGDAGPVRPATDDLTMYFQGAMVGAGLVALVGYVSLTFAMKR